MTTLYLYRYTTVSGVTATGVFYENPTEDQYGTPIDSGSLTVLQQISADTVRVDIIEERVSTNEHFQTTTLAIDVPSGIGWSETSKVWNYPISILEGAMLVSNEHQGDYIEALYGDSNDPLPNTEVFGFTIGALSGTTSSGENVIYVTDTAIENCDPGYCVHVFDGANFHYLGECLFKSVESGTITTALPASGTLSAGMYVKQRVFLIENFMLAGNGHHTVGNSVNKGNYFKEGYELKLRYYNADGVAGKKFAIKIEFYY